MVCEKKNRVATIFFCFFISTIFYSCENDIQKVKLFADLEKLPSEYLKDATIFYSDSAKITAKLTAKKIDHYTGKRSFTVMPKGINVIFYNSAEQPETKMKADYAIKYDDMDVIESKRNVVVVNEKGETLNTEHLIWDQKKDRIFTDVFVKITTKKEILMGDGLESNQSFSKYKILKLRGTIQMNE